MKIKSVVVHEIKKAEKTTGAVVIKTVKALDHTDANTIKIITDLDSSFDKKTPRKAKLSTDGFKKVITDFKAINLLEKSKDLIDDLKIRMEGIPAAKGGYLVFSEYQTNKNYLAVFLIRDTESPLLELQDDNTWDVKLSEHLDVEHFAMGVQINLDILNSDSNDRYVSLVKGNTDVSSYFEKWVGIDDTKHETKDADALYEISNLIHLPDGVKTRNDFKKKIHDFVKSQPSRNVNIKALSQHLYEDEDTIANYCDKNEIDIDGEFKLSASQLNKFYKLIINAGGIELRAARSKFKPDGIVVSPDLKSVIIYSEEFAVAVNEGK